MKKKNKTGELTTQQLVTLIILIVSFGIILFLIFGLDLGKTTDKEICHNSVVLKGQSILKSGTLDCKTTYVCISGGGKCEGFNEDYTIDINMNQGADKIKNDTMKAIADEMADCWWMFGEAEIDYVGGIHFVGDKLCAICSVIDFDTEIQKKSSQIKTNYSEFYNFLKTTPKDKTQVYLKYLYDTYDLSDLKYPEEDFDFNEQYSILTGMAKKGVLSEAIFGGLRVAKPFTFWIYDKTTGKKEEGDKEFIPPTILKKTKENYDSLNCGEFITKV